MSMRLLGLLGATIGLLIGLAGNILMWTWLRPVTAAQVISIFFFPSLLNILSAVVLLIGDIIINLILVDAYDWFALREMINEYLLRFNNCTFEPVESSEITGARESVGNQSRLPIIDFFLHRTHMFRAFHVWSPTEDRPAQAKAFQMLGTRSYLFLPSRPSLKPTTGTFLLLHELGHAHAMHLFFVNQRLFITCYLLLLAVNIHLRPGFSAAALYVSTLMMPLWIIYVIKRRVPTEEYAEFMADSLAFLLLSRSPFHLEICRKVVKLYRRFKDQPLRLAQADLLERQIELWEESAPDRGRLSPSGWEIPIALSRFTLPPVWVSVPAFVGLIYIGSKLSVNDWPTLAIVLIAWIVVPLLVKRFIIMPSLIVLRVQVAQFLFTRASKADPVAQEQPKLIDHYI